MHVYNSRRPSETTLIDLMGFVFLLFFFFFVFFRVKCLYPLPLTFFLQDYVYFLLSYI